MMNQTKVRTIQTTQICPNNRTFMLYFEIKHKSLVLPIHLHNSQIQKQYFTVTFCNVVHFPPISATAMTPPTPSHNTTSDGRVGTSKYFKLHEAASQLLKLPLICQLNVFVLNQIPLKKRHWALLLFYHQNVFI